MRRLLVIFILLSSPILAPLIARADWSTPIRISELGGGYYPQIISQGDTLHILYENTYGYDKICYLRSTDGGDNWIDHTVLSENNGAVNIPHILRWGNNLMALWRIYFNTGVYRLNIQYSISTNDGHTWSVPQRVFDVNWELINFYSASSFDSLVNIILYTDWSPDTTFYSIRSLDFGQSWSDRAEIFRAAQSDIPDQVNIGNSIYFVWGGRFNLNERTEIHNIKSTNGGASWLPNITLSDSDQYHSQMPAITADYSTVGCTWMDFKYSPYFMTGDIFLRSCPDSGSNWTPENQITNNHLAMISDITLSGDTIFIVWVDYRTENIWESIYATKSTDGGLLWDEPFWIDGDTGGSSRYPSISFSNHKAFLIWYDQILPDSPGVYFSRYDFEADAIREDNGDNNILKKTNLSVYPNPFNSSAYIIYSSKKGGEINIYNASGQFIRSFNVEAAEEGRIVWDGKDRSGKKVATGTYFMRFLSEGNCEMVKIIYLK